MDDPLSPAVVDGYRRLPLYSIQLFLSGSLLSSWLVSLLQHRRQLRQLTSMLQGRYADRLKKGEQITVTAATKKKNGRKKKVFAQPEFPSYSAGRVGGEKKRSPPPITENNATTPPQRWAPCHS